MSNSSMTGNNAAPILLLITAPSGAGKTTLCQNLINADTGVDRVITCTTRTPRENEVQGVDYHFLDNKTFEKGIQEGEFLEHASVYGNHYGTRRKDVTRHFEDGHDVLLNIDVQGAESVRKQANLDATLRDSLVTVFLSPPSLNELENRLRNRNSDDEATILKRLAHAKKEIENWKLFDYLIVSGSRSQDLEKIQSILRSERLKSARQRLPESICGAN